MHDSTQILKAETAILENEGNGYHKLCVEMAFLRTVTKNVTDYLEVG